MYIATMLSAPEHVGDIMMGAIRRTPDVSDIMMGVSQIMMGASRAVAGPGAVVAGLVRALMGV